jgi:hypothetical protein
MALDIESLRGQPITPESLGLILDELQSLQDRVESLLAVARQRGYRHPVQERDHQLLSGELTIGQWEQQNQKEHRDSYET